MVRDRPACGSVRAVWLLVLCTALRTGAASAGPASETLVIRGQEQSLHAYGTRGARVAIVASGDGGWIHLGPDVAEFLASRGYFVLGFDSKAYLSSFTQGSKTLTVEDIAPDFARLLDYAAKPGGEGVLLIGVSEGAALAVLAGADQRLKPRLTGVVGLGLPDQAELGWRFRDAVIYVTKGVPKEPLFSTAEFVAKIAPVPLAVVQSTHDEFVPRADIERVMARAAQPSRLWMIDASNHRFGGKTEEFQARLLEAIDWIGKQRR